MPPIADENPVSQNADAIYPQEDKLEMKMKDENENETKDNETKDH